MNSSTPFVDELGRSTGLERPRLNAGDFIERALGFQDTNSEDMSGRIKRQEIVRARELLVSLGVERYSQRVTDLAATFGVRYDTASL